MIETAFRATPGAAASAPDTTFRPEQAVWNLLMPPANPVFCVASHVPAWVGELQRRGVDVDVVAPAADARPPRARTYELAVVWEPGSLAELQHAIDAVQHLAPPVRVLWACNPNPVLQRGAVRLPTWRHVDARLRRAGWQIRARHVGLPDSARLRQIVEWERYPGPGLIRHARSHRWWKAWITRLRLYRWRLPVRALTATRQPGDVETRGGPPPVRPLLSHILDAASLAQACDIALQRLLVSPNGVAIALIDRIGRDPAGVLKIPFLETAEPRVRNNARALRWWLQPPAALVGWSNMAPQFLGAGDVGAWSYTIEERVSGTSLHEWKAADAAVAVERLGEFLRALHAARQETVRLEATSLEALLGPAIRHIQALLDADLAHRLQATYEGAIQTLNGVSIPLVPRHGDFKLDNVLGTPGKPSSLRVLDWELWTPRGLPLLDAAHLVVSRARRREGIALGDAVCRWLERGRLEPDDQRWVDGVWPDGAADYGRVLPLLYWLDRIGPAAARGAWPSVSWVRANVERPLLQLSANAVGVET